MAGLDPAIHASKTKDVDARHEAGHDIENVRRELNDSHKKPGGAEGSRRVLWTMALPGYGASFRLIWPIPAATLRPSLPWKLSG